MKKVEMSAAGLAVLLERAECFLRLWDIMSYPGQQSTPMHADLMEASREARIRLEMPPREPRSPDGTLRGEEVGASVAVTMLDQQKEKETFFEKGKHQVTPLPADLQYPTPPVHLKAILETPTSRALAEKRRQAMELVQAAMAIEDRFPNGPMPLAEEEEVKALLVRADVLEGEIDLLDSRHNRRICFKDDHPQVKDAYNAVYGSERAAAVYRVHQEGC